MTSKEDNIKKLNGADTEASAFDHGQILEVSDRAKELFEREQGLRYALQYLGEQSGLANKAAWAEVYKSYPKLADETAKFAVFEDKLGTVKIVDPIKHNEEAQAAAQAKEQPAN